MSILGIGALVTTGLVAAPLIASSLAETTEPKMITQATKQHSPHNQLKSNLSSLEKYAEKKANTISPKNVIMQKLLSKKGQNNLGR